jgi:hypothetical protein
MVATHPSSRYDNSESSLLIDATRKADFPPLSLPKEEFMVRAKEIWEEIGSAAVSAARTLAWLLMGLCGRKISIMRAEAGGTQRA